MFDQGLTIAAFIKPDRTRGHQSIVRKRLDGTSAFLLAMDDRELEFVVHLSNGRMAGVSAPVKAGRQTHVAATYDGQQLRLYLDGKLAAEKRAKGKLARGAGPIFVGNDANGRRFDGVVDEVWLNNLAAPADAILGLTCIRRAPLVSVAPGSTEPQVAGTSVEFAVSVTNQNDAACPSEAFSVYPSLPFELTSNNFGSTVFAGPDETVSTTVDVRSLKSTPVGTFPFQVHAYDQASYSTFGFADASYVVSQGPISCEGYAPFTSAITGSFDSPVIGTYTFGSPDLAAPVVTSLPAPDGSIAALSVAANPGATTDPANAFTGLGLFFGNPACLDASAFSGVQFTIDGDLGTCQLSFSAIMSQNNRVEYGPFGVCTAVDCYSPSSPPIGVGTTVVRFSDLTGGAPVSEFDPSALNDVQWTLTAPTDGVTEPCVANFTIRDVSFVTDAAQASVNYTFDSDTQGWFINTWEDPEHNNIGAFVPEGATPPSLEFSLTSGNPTPGALVLTAPFTAPDQFLDVSVDPNVSRPGLLSLTGRKVRARLRLVSGSAPHVQLSASSAPDYAFFGAFVDSSQLIVGEWLTVELDFATSTDPIFDPTQILQLGVQVSSVDPSGGPVVIEIDTITDG